VNSIMIYTWVW